jgi:hypothetical protein
MISASSAARAVAGREKCGGGDAGKEGSAGNGQYHDGFSQVLEFDLCPQRADEGILPARCCRIDPLDVGA